MDVAYLSALAALAAVRRATKWAGVLALLLYFASGARADDTARPVVGSAPAMRVLAVQTTGVIPGLNEQDTVQYIASQMTAARQGALQFRAGCNEVPCTADRVEWILHREPDAAGTVKEIGSSHGYVRIDKDPRVRMEAHLVLSSIEQRVVSGSGTLQDLGTLIMTLTVRLLDEPPGASTDNAMQEH